MLTKSLMLSITLALGVSLPTASTYVANAEPPQSSVQSSKKPLPGCANAQSTIGGVRSLQARIHRDSTLVMTWKAPITRRGVEILGYNIYGVNPSTGVFELRQVETDATTVLDLRDIPTDASGRILVQIAAFSDSAEGCRNGEALAGPVKLPRQTDVTLTNWEDLKCADTANRMIFSVAGYYKGLAGGAKAVSFGLLFSKIGLDPGDQPYEDFSAGIEEAVESSFQGGEVVINHIRCSQRK
jgi:hypothetical protein